jgi:Zn-finger nucleic acid-binding protein
MGELKESQSGQMGVKVKFCPNCNGLWISLEEIRKKVVEGETDFSLSDSPTPHPVECPECGKTLHAVAFPYMESRVGMCKRCNGLWVEGRDIKQFFQALRSLRGYGVPAQYKKRKGFLSRLIGDVFS